jgi:hypothetical protein
LDAKEKVSIILQAEEKIKFKEGQGNVNFVKIRVKNFGDIRNSNQKAAK